MVARYLDQFYFLFHRILLIFLRKSSLFESEAIFHQNNSTSSRQKMNGITITVHLAFINTNRFDETYQNLLIKLNSNADYNLKRRYSRKREHELHSKVCFRTRLIEVNHFIIKCTIDSASGC